jgi:hypothetical protein
MNSVNSHVKRGVRKAERGIAEAETDAAAQSPVPNPQSLIFPLEL